MVLAALCCEGTGRWEAVEKRGASLTHSLFRPRPSGLAGKHARTRDCSRAEADFLHWSLVVFEQEPESPHRKDSNQKHHTRLWLEYKRTTELPNY